MIRLLKCFFVWLWSITPQALAETTFESGFEDTTAIHGVVISYYSALAEKNSEKVLSCMAEDFFMFNGNNSGSPEDWQAHLYLRGKQLEEWVSNFIEDAGPHENQVRFIHTHIRANAAIVVTLETGKNKFRTWQDEKVTWQLGKDAGKWKLIGFFIRDIRNPE